MWVPTQEHWHQGVTGCEEYWWQDGMSRRGWRDEQGRGGEQMRGGAEGGGVSGREQALRTAG